MTLRPIANSQVILNRLHKLLRYSAANYLRFARPWTSDSDHVLLSIIFKIAYVQKESANRIERLLMERRANPELGNFPMDFTDLNHLSIRYSAGRVVEDLSRIISELRLSIQALRRDVVAARLLQEVLEDEEHNLVMLRSELRHLAEQEHAIREENITTELAAPQHDSQQITSRTAPGPLAV